MLSTSTFWSSEAARRESRWRWIAPRRAGRSPWSSGTRSVGHVACIPTKALVGSARTVLMARHAEVMGVELGDQPLVSVNGLRQHKSSVVDGMVAAHKKMFADSGMDFILGTARFIAPRTVEVETRDETIRLLRGTDVVINTGTTPAVPDLPGITESRVWTSETILQLERLPQRLIVLGVVDTSVVSTLRCSRSSALR